MATRRDSRVFVAKFKTVLREDGVICSMSSSEDCWDNAVAESFFATLEWDPFGDRSFVTRAATHRALIVYIDN